MWGFTPAQDLLRDSPLKGEVSLRLIRQILYLFFLRVMMSHRKRKLSKSCLGERSSSSKCEDVEAFNWRLALAATKL